MEHKEPFTPEENESKKGMTRREFIKKTFGTILGASLSQPSPKEENRTPDQAFLEEVTFRQLAMSERPEDYRKICDSIYSDNGKCTTSQLMDPFENKDFVLKAFQVKDGDQPTRYSPNTPSVKIDKNGKTIEVTFYQYNGEEALKVNITKDHKYAGMLTELIKIIGFKIENKY